MKIRFLLAGLFIHAISFGQNNLSGTWVLQNKTHVSGPEYTNAIPKQIRLHPQGDSLIMESVFEEDGQDVSSRQAVPMNGQPVSNIGAKSNRKYIKSLKWDADKKGLVLTVVIHVPDNPNEVDFTRVETWSLSPDNKYLNLNKKSVETRSETWETKGTYVRKLVEE